MLKINLLQKFHFFKKHRRILFFFGGVLLWTIIINILVWIRVPQWKALMNQKIGQGYTVDFDGIYYSPPHGVVFKHVLIKKKDQRLKINVPKVRCDLSVWRTLTSFRPQLRKIVFIRPNVKMRRGSDDIDLKKIIKLISACPYLQVKVCDMKGEMISDFGVKEFQKIKMSLKLNKGEVGFFADIPIEEKHSVTIQTKFSCLRNQVYVDSFDVKKADFLAVHLNGYTVLDELFVEGYVFADPIYVVSYRTLIDQWIGRAVEYSYYRHRACEIKGRIDLQKNNLIFKDFSWVIDRIPMKMDGNILLASPVEVGLHLSADIRKRDGRNKNIQMSLMSVFGKKPIISNGWIDVVYHQEKGFRGYGIDFEDAYIKMDKGKSLLFEVAKGGAYLHFNRQKERLLFDHLKALGTITENRVSNIAFLADFYEGKINGDFDIQQNNDYSGKIVFNDANINLVRQLTYDCSKFEGQVDGEFQIKRDPKFSMDGDFKAKDGRLTQLRFLDWIVEYFKYPALSEVPFEMLSAHFSYNADAWSLTSVDLASSDLNVTGDFHSNYSRLLRSEFILAFDREFIQQSSVLLPLVKRVKDDEPTLDLHFRLFGSLDRISFQWVQSDVKEKVEGVLPNFIKNKIEQKVAGSIQ